MPKHRYAESFEDLQVYIKALELQQQVFELSKRFPREEIYSLTDQVRRSSRSIGANIAEAWRKRRYEAHFVSKITDSDAEQSETVHWAITARNCGYISVDEFTVMKERCIEIGRLLGAMMKDSSRWCR